MTELFNDNKVNRSLITIDNKNILEIRTDEANYELKCSMSGKATGPDKVPIEIVKLIEKENINILTDLFNSIYRSGNIPKYLLCSVFVTFPKIS